MRCPRLLKATICHVWVFVCVLGHAGLIGESAAQDLPSDSPSEPSREFQSKRLGKVVPFAGLEERLRQSSRWQTMTPEEQAQALEKIGLARKQILERQLQLQKQYEDQIQKIEKKPRETLMSKRRKRERYQDQDRGRDQEVDELWRSFQGLPVEKRIILERNLGLDKVLFSQHQKKFQENLDRLSSSERDHILRQLKPASR